MEVKIRKNLRHLLYSVGHRPYKYEVATTRTTTLIAVDNVPEDHTDCIYPSGADPEAWACDCIDDMKTRCIVLGKNPDWECFHGLMCDAPSVCGDWKKMNCIQSPNFLGKEVHSDLDESLKAKHCHSR